MRVCQPACMATSSGSASVSLPTPFAQPPMPSWQSACISNPIPMAQFREFLAQDVEQNQPTTEESSTLAQVVARRMTPEQQADHIRDRTWHRSEMEKRRRMAQPGWKAAMEAQGTSLIQQQERVTQALLRSGQTPPTAPGMQPLTTIGLPSQRPRSLQWPQRTRMRRQLSQLLRLLIPRNGMRGGIFRRVPAAATELLFRARQSIFQPSTALSKADASNPVCVEYGQMKSSLCVNAQTPAFFSFRVSRFYRPHGATRRSVMSTHTHIAHSLRQLHVRTWHRRVGSNRQQRRVSALHCWRVLRPLWSFLKCSNVSALSSLRSLLKCTNLSGGEKSTWRCQCGSLF